jgi:hypothetical protein
MLPLRPGLRANGAVSYPAFGDEHKLRLQTRSLICDRTPIGCLQKNCDVHLVGLLVYKEDLPHPRGLVTGLFGSSTHMWFLSLSLSQRQPKLRNMKSSAIGTCRGIEG